MAHTLTHYRLSPLNRQTGLSLVELMISLTIGLVLLTGLTTLIVQQSHTRNELEKSSRQIENGRYAMQILRGDIQHAGFYGQYFTLPAPPAALPNPCLTTPLTGSPSLFEAMSLHIQGYDAPAVVAAPLSTCLNNANHVAGTDILVIRRVDTSNIIACAGLTTITNASTGAGGLVYLQASTASQVLATGTLADTTKFPLTYSTTACPASTPVELRTYLVYIYFVSPCSTMANGTTCTATDDNGQPIPTLKRLELSATGAATTFTLITPLVEGIENLQLDYGIDNDSDGYPDSYTTAPATTAAWSNVMAIRVNLLARNTECTVGYTDNKTYNLGLAGAVPVPASNCTNGGYKRHVFSELIRAVNPSGRRAQQ